jgi:hypothetical protein
MINPIDSAYKHALAQDGIIGKIDNVTTSFIIKEKGDKETLIAEIPFHLGSLVDIGTNKYIVSDYNKSFNHSIYNQGTIEPIQAIRVSSINTYAIVNYINGVSTGTNQIQWVQDKYAFTVPFCNAKVNDIITYKNMEYKINSVDYSKESILTLYADYKGISNTYAISLSETTKTVQANSTYQIVPICKENDVIVTSPTIKYVSNNIAIATVSSTGLITGVAEGSTSITCTYNGVVATLSLTVSAVATSTPIKVLSADNNEYVKINNSETFTVYVDDGDSYSRILTSGRTFSFVLDEDTIDYGIATIVSYTDTTVTIKALTGEMFVLTTTDNADPTKTVDNVLYGIN